MADQGASSSESPNGCSARVPESLQEFEHAVSNASGGDVLVVQFTATWCKRCETLKKEVAETFSKDLKYLVVDVDAQEEIAEVQSPPVSQLPRFDVFGGGRKVESLSGHDASIERLRAAVSTASAPPPPLELDADF